MATEKKRKQEKASPLGFAVIIVLLIAAVFVAWSLFYETEERRPNVLLISVDTLRADHLGCYGYGRNTSPVLDRFAQDRAFLFETVIAAAPSTEPSHASMFTSLLPSHHGALFSRRAPLPSKHITLAEFLKQAGYRTTCVNDGGQMDAQWGLNQGFDSYVTLPGRAPKAKFQRTVDEALRWFDADINPLKPWFMFLHTYETHHPYNPEQSYYRAIGHEYTGDLPKEIDKPLLQSINEGKRLMNDKDKAHIIAAYDAEIRSMDTTMGKFLAELHRRDLDKNTIIIITSDHGEELGDHGMMGWHSHALWDEQLLVPLFIALPNGSHGGKRFHNQVRGIDLLPTILDLLNIKPPENAEGRSVMSIVRGERDEPRLAVSQRDTVSTPLPATLRIGNKKLYERSEESTTLLFDLEADPMETINTYVPDPSNITDLKKQLDSLISSRPEFLTETPVEMNEPTRKQLESLGYIEVNDGGPDAGGMALDAGRNL